jgi:GWxTD domain-containing protein
MKALKPYFIFLFISFLIACGNTKRLSTQNVIHLYKSDKDLNPEYIVYHINSSESRIYFLIQTKDISFKKKSVDEDEIARLRLSAKLFTNYESETVIDTSSKFIDKTLNEIHTINNVAYIYDSIDIRIQSGNNYLLQIMLSELNESKFYTVNMLIEKESINNRQHFRISNEENKTLFNYNFKINETVNIEHYKKPEKYFVRYYKRDFPIASPIFVNNIYHSFNYKADSLFSINTSSGTSAITFSNEGFYHLQTDTLTDKEGVTFFVFGKNFPEVSTPENMLEPLRYITSKEEYQEMAKAENMKLQIEKFWLNAGGSSERARELIKKFYGRVYQANSFFSCYKEGWKTDRGMLFIIFGAPNIVHRSTNTEVWIYGEENNMMSLSFAFLKVTNPFTDNDYVLDRSIVYKNNWYRAVETWRQGRIY